MRITLPSGTPAEVALPDGDPAAGLVLFPDIGGLRPLFDDLCAQLARENNWAVVAPEPFPGREQMDLAQRMETVTTLVDDDVLGDAIAAADATECERIGVLGFCMGGMYTIKATGLGRFYRAVSFYGMITLPDAWKAPGQSEPLSYLGRPGACPLMAILGTEDPYTPSADIDLLRAADGEVVVYDGAEHGFVHDPDRDAHRADDAADAWRRTIDFLTPLEP